MHTGLGTSSDWPVNVSRPVAWSIANTVTVFESWPPARRNFPVGSSTKFRGVLPRIGSTPVNVSRPVGSSTENMAIE
jgi:hypothetical protein